MGPKIRAIQVDRKTYNVKLLPDIHTPHQTPPWLPEYYRFEATPTFKYLPEHNHLKYIPSTNGGCRKKKLETQKIRFAAPNTKNEYCARAEKKNTKHEWKRKI